MAAVAARGLWRGCGSIFASTAWNRTGWPFLHCTSALQTGLSTSTPLPSVLHQYRHSSFFNKLTADELWRGVLAESGAGARKGRGKRTKRKIKKDLNRGQMVGEGRAGFLWPGLNAPVVKSGTIQSIGKRDQKQQEDLQAQALRQQEEWDKKRKMKVKRERGWTGSSWGGISLGPPDPGPNGETYEDFDSKVIEVKSVFNMTAKEGRKRSISALVVVGNGNGAAGFALGKAPDRTTALRKAKNRAIHYLYFIERYNDHTIYHDITSKFKRTTIKMKKQNYGYGLHCHRAIITICKLIGIKDMYAKVTGSTNLLNITRSLFQGLSKQETHNDLADRKGLHVVEFRSECGPLPIIVASPRGAVRNVPEPEDEIPDIKLDWGEVKAAQGMKRSIWANVKRTIW
ncbi:28S ribosomal protein S5, mitochondrial [Pristis pectinata]|uniref:28S ribosomal protein S5, mitochondrial n=1 Tax=Pristis pectinata TaxID=685728 RepID=UPI00223DBAED|nr:28S ribosomal protein S5, mitochondrial [Pristis pectinata]